MKSGMAYFDLLPKEVRRLIYLNKNLSVKDLTALGVTSKRHHAEIHEAYPEKLNQQFFHGNKINLSLQEIKKRISELKNLFIEAEYFRRTYMQYYDGASPHYSEEQALQLIHSIPKEKRLETICMPKQGQPSGMLISIFNILHDANQGKKDGEFYKKGDEFIALQIPWFLSFLTGFDFFTICSTKGRYDRNAFIAFVKNPQLVLSIDPKLINGFTSRSNAKEIYALIIANPEIEAHVSQDETIKNALETYKEQQERIRNQTAPFEPEEFVELYGRGNDTDYEGDNAPNKTDDVEVTGFRMGSFR